MIWLTGWKSHSDNAKKFLDKKSNMHLTAEKCVCLMTQKQKHNHVNVFHNRLHGIIFFVDHNMEMDHGFMGMTQK